MRCLSIGSGIGHTTNTEDQEVEFDAGWFASLTLPTVPRAEVLLNIADHEWYHVGQLTSYLWARGVDPYTGGDCAWTG